MFKIVISSSADSLAKIQPDYTVEAEYGDTVVEGKKLTLAHHGARSANPPPCVAGIDAQEPGVIGVSHIDLDSIGGIMAVMGCKPDKHLFWRVAGEIDIKGVHKLSDISGSAVCLDALNAWWAWSESHKVFPPRDGSVSDITQYVTEAVEALTKILSGDTELTEAGKEFAKRKMQLDTESYCDSFGRVILRSSDQFVNHLYRHSQDVVVSFNATYNSVTVSCADPIPGFSCKDFVQSLWGDKAGGHTGIAGSPRGQVMTLADAEEAARILYSQLR